MSEAARRAAHIYADVSRETRELLERYELLIQKWTRTINLVSSSTLHALRDRHILDSMQLWELTSRRGRWVDLGSGGGFPGLVIAVLARHHDDLQVVLVEADQRKATFLRTALRELGLDAEVVAQRIEALPCLDADIISARALAPLTKLLTYTEQHRKSDGVALFPKGENADAEIAEALESWQFDCQKHASITDERSIILSIGEISRV